jgi:ComF family protein
MRAIEGPVCDICGERLVSHHLLDEAEGRGCCGLCRAEAPPFTKAAAYGSYEAGLRELIHLLKYDRVRPAAGVLGRMLAEALTTLSPHFGPVSPVVVPVPLHRLKERQRGFNQSELIAAESLKRLPLCLTINKGTLVRVRPTESQTGLTRRQRQENMRGAFRVARPELIAGSDVLLVDDVFTTGTTISECARVLRRAGAERVFAATVARVLKGDATGAQPEEDVDNEPLTMAAQA